MTEQEWFTAGPGELYQYLLDRHETIRNYGWRETAARLACLARLGPPPDGVIRRWVETATAYLDCEDRDQAERDHPRMTDVGEVMFAMPCADAKGVINPKWAAVFNLFGGGGDGQIDGQYHKPAYRTEAAFQANIIRCIFGNPFRPVAFSPAWRSESAVALARTAYDTRNFTLLPILADALEEAGCDHPDMLAHCRDPNATHARGCWVVDLVLNKS